MRRRYRTGGRLLPHAGGRDALQATDEVVDRLRRQIRRALQSEVALRNEPQERVDGPLEALGAVCRGEWAIPRGKR